MNSPGTAAKEGYKLFEVQELWVRLVDCVAAFRDDRAGVTALEYGIIASLIAVAIVNSVLKVGNHIASTFSVLASSV